MIRPIFPQNLRMVGQSNHYHTTTSSVEEVRVTMLHRLNTTGHASGDQRLVISMAQLERKVGHQR